MNKIKGPVSSELKEFIKDKVWVEFYTVTDKTFKGQILWVDDDACHLLLENSQRITLFKGNIVCYSKCQ